MVVQLAVVQSVGLEIAYLDFRATLNIWKSFVSLRVDSCFLLS